MLYLKFVPYPWGTNAGCFGIYMSLKVPISLMGLRAPVIFEGVAVFPHKIQLAVHRSQVHMHCIYICKYN